MAKMACGHPNTAIFASAWTGERYCAACKGTEQLTVNEPEPQFALPLASLMSHVAAPNWYLAARGHGQVFGFRMGCPVCGSLKTRIRTSDPVKDAFILQRADSGSVSIPTSRGGAKSDDPHSRDFTGVAIPMCCDQGHEWLLDVTQSFGEPALISVTLSEQDYPTLYPEDHAKWGDGSDLGLSDDSLVKAEVTP